MYINIKAVALLHLYSQHGLYKYMFTYYIRLCFSTSAKPRNR